MNGHNRFNNYMTACMAYMSASSGYAAGINRVNELTVQATENIKRDNPELLRYNLLVMDMMAILPKVIHVGGATPTVPQALYDKIKCRG